MKSCVTALLGVFLFLVLAIGCAPHPPRHTVILTPDPAGHVGKAEVFTDGGTQLLEKPFAMTTVSSRSSAPAQVTLASAEFITATFADVLAIEPPPAEKFILYFNTNTAELVPESLATFTTIMATIKRRGAISISVSGHTDSSGPVQLNEKLANNRARTVRDLLVQMGVDAERLTVSSHGKGNQLVPTADGVAEPRNRRVEVIVR